MRSKEHGSTSDGSRDSKEWTGIFVIFSPTSTVPQSSLKKVLYGGTLEDPVFLTFYIYAIPESCDTDFAGLVVYKP